MRITRRTMLGGLAATTAGGMFNGAVTPATATEGSSLKRPKHVVLVDFDGFDPDYLDRVDTPNLDRLAKGGSFAVADATFHTISNPVRASMSTGAFPEVHGNAAYGYDPTTNTAHGQSRFLAAETIAQALAESGKTIASVQWYMVQNFGVVYGDPEHLYVQPGGTIDRRVDAAIEILHQRPVDSGGELITVPKIPDLLAVYSSDLDSLGHREGPDSPNIATVLAEHDRQLDRLIQATKDVGIYDETAFILTSDHGMTGWNRTLLPIVVDAINDLGYNAEIVTPGNSPADDTDVIIVPNAVRVGDFTLRGRADGRVARRGIAATLRRLPHISKVLTSDDLARLRASDKLGDIVAEAKPPWAFALSEPPEGEWRGSHGSLSEIKVPLYLSGAGIDQGVLLRRPRTVDVAPTIAALLGIRAPAQAQGRVLSESLEL